MAADAEPRFKLGGISKAFGGIRALDEVDLAVQPGEIHALVGENGAGKSTLIRIATGALRPDAGEIRLAGSPQTLPDPLAAARLGIVAVHQEAELFAELSLAENMLLGEGLRRSSLGLVDWPRTYRDAADELRRMEEYLDVKVAAGRIGVGRRVTAGVAAAVARKPEVLFLDEPTASLTAVESRQMFDQLVELKATGVAIIYVSHRLEEVLELADTITVLRDGRNVATRPASEFDIDQLVAAMIGRETASFFHREPGKPGPVLFEANSLSSPDGRFHDVSFSVRSGEIVGLYGLVGSGRSEMARAIFGLERLVGSFTLHGKKSTWASPYEATERGLAYVPEDRLTEGIFARLSCESNVTSAVLRRLSRVGVIDRRQERTVTQNAIERFQVRLDSPRQPMNTLSGGNQQKLVLARWLETRPELLILDEPTRGVDVGAKAEIHRLIDELAGQGKGVVLISSELPEVLRMSDRVLVMCEGRLTGEFDPKTVRDDAVAAAAFPDSRRVGTPESARTPGGRLERLLRFRELGILAALLAIVLGVYVLGPESFATMENLLDILTAASIVSIAAAGMTLVIVSGGIDISIGSLLGLVGAVAALAAQQGHAPVVCLALAVVLGALAGTANASLCRLGNIHPIIVTLAGISIYRGVLLQVTGGREIVPLPDSYRALADGQVLGAPKVLWYAVAVLGLNWVLLSRTLLGRRMLAVGNSEKAAELIGISPWKYRTLAFAILGASVGLASVLWGGYYGKIQSNTGRGWELTVIAATVIGGCSILGGRGTALGAFLGSVLIALVYNALILLRVDPFWQDCFVGGLILGAVLTDVWLPVLLERRK